jgi:hypothetical protein
MTERAHAEYRTAIKLDRAYEDALYYTGVMYARNKKNGTEMVRLWEDLLKIVPTYPQAEHMHSMTATLKNTIKKDAR